MSKVAPTNIPRHPSRGKGKSEHFSRQPKSNYVPKSTLPGTQSNKQRKKRETIDEKQRLTNQAHSEPTPPCSFSAESKTKKNVASVNPEQNTRNLFHSAEYGLLEDFKKLFTCFSQSKEIFTKKNEDDENIFEVSLRNRELEITKLLLNTAKDIIEEENFNKILMSKNSYGENIFFNLTTEAKIDQIYYILQEVLEEKLDMLLKSTHDTKYVVHDFQINF